ncbi:type II secretion system F family protein [Aquibacillus koreensis]|uniref:Type II secretion system F family protein n=1 Tax=Aquibacillus koreensis TaxID=279446 RepID=A0A9X3WIE4_9BACI|nr:type II secretion system F family protein [Aquibacillus koreensis]MCT2537946.1 type II secretion system F family protein [Aquibacillus koreensis]MDC3419163.1 type II secretion system F family protein [Aquibacillus koreensis]
MPYFRYKGRSVAGKAQSGKIDADTKHEAIAKLKRDGITVFKIEKLNSVLYKDINIGKTIKNRDFVIFLRQFATLIDAGISLVETTSILQDQTTNKFLKKALEDIEEDLEEGVPLSEALEKQPKLFPELLVSMINAGEISGNLDDILDNMASYYEKQYQLKQKIVTALTYPIVIGVISVFITIFLLAFIVPVFTDMLSSFGQDIPAYTAFILSLSGVVQAFWWLIILVFILLFFVYKFLERKPTYAFLFDTIKLRIPVFGGFIQKSLLARMTQTLSSLLNSSVPILQSVDITERVIANRVIKGVLKESKVALEQGESLASPMIAHWVFPKLVTQMIAVGERTGSLDAMLKKVSDFYEQELDEASDKLKSLVEPIMIVFLAVVVGAIVMAIVIPMFSLFENI